jgi:Putative methyltransferase
VFRFPALHALLIFLISFLLVLILEYGMSVFGAGNMGSIVFVFLQGIIAAFIAYRQRLASWWIGIQFFFPGMLMAMHGLHLPSYLYLAAFVFLLGLYWTTFRTQVPFYPSGKDLWRAVAEIMPDSDSPRAIRFIDIGSGLGGLVLNLAKQKPEGIFLGVEIAPLPWFISFCRAYLQRSKGSFILGDYTSLNFEGYDVIFAYLSPVAMPALWRKARTEMRPGTLLLSYEFPIPGIEAHAMISFDVNDPVLYAWHM